MAGFEFSYTLSGAAKRVQAYTAKNAAVFSAGEMVILDTGEADAGATGGVFLGVAAAECDNTDDGLTVYVIANPDAVFTVVDANARTINDALDVASGGMGVTTKSNDDLKVMLNSTATEVTHVMFNNTHLGQKATT
jgi:hypothetical protein